MLRFLGLSAAVCLATAACGGEDNAASFSSQSGGNPLPTEVATHPSGVVDSVGMYELARLDGDAESMTSDGTMLYVGMQDGRVLAVPQSGGEPTQLLAQDSATSGIAVDDAYVYVSSLLQHTVGRVPKGGGSYQLLAQNIVQPYQLAIDDKNVYVADKGSETTSVEVGHLGTNGRVLRIAKDGAEATMTLASAQQAPEAIAVDGKNVYFSSGPSSGADGSIRVVPKAGGDVKILARRLDAVNNFVIADGRAWFIDSGSKLLSYVLLDGSVATPAGAQTLSPFGLTSDGLSFFATTFDAKTNHVTLRRLDSEGRVTATLAEWTYAQGVTPIGSLATVTVPSKVYWVDLAQSESAVVRSTIRWAMRP